MSSALTGGFLTTAPLGKSRRGHSFLFIYLFIYYWLCWVFVSVRGLSLFAVSRGHSSSRCTGLSLLQPLLLRSTGSRCAGSVVVAHGPSRSAACGILPDQGSNPCPLHWQADSQPLRHQGSPTEEVTLDWRLRKVAQKGQVWMNRMAEWRGAGVTRSQDCCAEHCRFKTQRRVPKSRQLSHRDCVLVYGLLLPRACAHLQSGCQGAILPWG